MNLFIKSDKFYATILILTLLYFSILLKNLPNFYLSIIKINDKIILYNNNLYISSNFFKIIQLEKNVILISIFQYLR